MVWDARTSNGNETAKIRWRVLSYLRGAGLDIGCGPWKISPHAVGIDGNFYPGAPEGSKPNLRMDCSKLPIFADECFDFVFSSHLLEHIHDTEATLREWLRVLNPGGHLVLYLPHKNFYPNIGQPGANPDHKHDFVPADIVKVMRHVCSTMRGGLDLLENEERNAEDEYSFLQVYRKTEAPGFRDYTQPRAEKCAAIVRPGVYGDSLWASSIAYHLKREGYHVTVYTEPPGEEMLRHDPNVDRLIVTDKNVLPVHLFGPFWEAERKRYDRWINLVEVCEGRLLVRREQIIFEWPKAARHEHCNFNYLEAMHKVAEVPAELRVRFYPSAEEREWARRERLALGRRPVVVFAPAGSTPPKYWPHALEFAQELARRRVHVVIVGDIRELKFPEAPFIHVKGTDKWKVRQSLAFAQLADAVVGQETILTNAVCIEPMRKVVLLSHSSHENLTRDWFNTRALFGAVKCHPCHQIHFQMDTCTRDEATGAAACQAAIPAEAVIEALADVIEKAPQLAAAD